MQQTAANNQSISQIQDYEKQFTEIHCSQKQVCNLLCGNDQCTESPFMCANQKCKCYQPHPKCAKLNSKSLKIALEDKLVSYKNIQTKIKSEIQKGIQQLQKFQSILLKQCKQKFKQFVGLADFQRHFMNAIKLGKIDEITGKTIHSIYFNLKKSPKVLKMVETLEFDVIKIWTQFENDLGKLHFDINDRLDLFGCELFEDSKIILTKKQQSNIEEFFKSSELRIKSVRLLYRGSQSDFAASAFHNSCDGQTDTLTICENTYGKKFGGYTPLAWNSNESYYTDSTFKSFIFSLTNNHKLVSDEDSTNHQYCNPSHGPNFGDGHDLYIAEACHQNFNSYSNVGHLYKNGNYTTQNEDSWKLFIGSQQNYNFKVKEYEVWKVQFA